MGKSTINGNFQWQITFLMAIVNNYVQLFPISFNLGKSTTNGHNSKLWVITRGSEVQLHGATQQLHESYRIAKCQGKEAVHKIVSPYIIPHKIHISRRYPMKSPDVSGIQDGSRVPASSDVPNRILNQEISMSDEKNESLGMVPEHPQVDRYRAPSHF